nr:deoxyribodipyrimidine photo-lyase [Oceanococcus sp. HetDA_MAG_MS8]
MTEEVVLWWVRRDMRLDDNPALTWAAQQGYCVQPIFIHAPQEEGAAAAGAAARWWQHQALHSLQAQLAQEDGQLAVYSGDSQSCLQQAIRDTGAVGVIWNRLYEPAIVERDAKVKSMLKDADLLARSHAAALLYEPWTIQTKTGDPYKVFTPFWKACMRLTAPREPQPKAANLAWAKHQGACTIDDLGLDPQHSWTNSLAAHWDVSEAAAQQRLETFLNGALDDYAEDRNRPDLDGSSALSPYLHHGQISPHRVWARAHSADRDAESTRRFVAELGWREFAHHLLWHFPDTPRTNFNSRFNAFPWRAGAACGDDLEAWQRGQTGIDIVDAGMRQLWSTGWMHNRVRMLVGSLLTKNLGIHWHAGADWFWDTLVDADLASNTLGWQWVAGCGADAAPYFRIFNPDTQAEKFDPDGRYRKRWLSQQRRPDKPIVDPKASRAGALEAYAQVKG